MGLDFSHREAHWSYGGFMSFRIRLASEIGIDLLQMDGFKQDGNGGYIKGLSWKNIKDPVKLLLNHSDCDGELTTEQCRLIAPRLRELVKGWPDDYDKMMALELSLGMEEAALKGEPLVFL